MTTQIKIKCILLAVIILIPTTSQADKLQILTCEEPPMNYQEEGQIEGFTTDIVREIMQRIKPEAVIKMQPWKRVYRTGLENPNVVLFTAARTKERENLFHWVGPVVEKRWILFANKGSGFQLKSMEDVRKVRMIGVMRNDARHRLLINQGFDNIFVTEDHVQGLRMLLKGRVALWASSDFEAFIIANKLGFNTDRIEERFIIKTIQSYILISKNTPLTTVKKWQNAFGQLKKDGFLNSIAKKWAHKTGLPLSVKNGMLAIVK